jgi:post-segregation antitoxin (ccd killing protein)
MSRGRGSLQEFLGLPESVWNALPNEIAIVLLLLWLRLWRHRKTTKRLPRHRKTEGQWKCERKRDTAPDLMACDQVVKVVSRVSDAVKHSRSGPALSRVLAVVSHTPPGSVRRRFGAVAQETQIPQGRLHLRNKAQYAPAAQEMRILRRMPRLQVYLPDDLYHAVKERRLPASELLQGAVRAELRRRQLLDETDRYLAELADEVGEPSAAAVSRAESLSRRVRGQKARAPKAS